MPVSLNAGAAKATTDNYGDTQIGPLQFLQTFQFTVRSGASVSVQLAKNNRDGKPVWDTEDIPFDPGSYGFNGVQGIRFKSLIPGTPGSIIATGYYVDDAVPFNSPLPSGGVTQFIQLQAGGSPFKIPNGATTLVVVCVGGGGGGGGGGRSGNNATAATGGDGGGGGACTIQTYSAARLLALFPAGVPYAIGLGGAGGAGGTIPARGLAGTGTTFGQQRAGGGGMGRANSPNNGVGGMGAGITDAILTATGIPGTGSFSTAGVGSQGVPGVAQSSPSAPSEYGGAGGGSNSAASIGGVSVGFCGGNSAWGGPGGGGGGGYVGVAARVNRQGGIGGKSGTYVNNSAAGTGSNASGTYTGPYTGDAGDGGDGATIGGASANGGGTGSVGAGGGGGGASGAGAAGNGGKGGDGAIYIFAV